MPAAPPVRRRLAWFLLVVGVAGVGFVWWRLRPSEERVPEVPTDGDGRGDLAGHGSERKPTSGVVDPLATPTGPVAAEEAKAGLRSRLEAVRIRALEDIARRGGTVDRETLDLLEKSAAGPDGREKAWAQAALMKVEGSRRFLREIAERAAASPFPDVYDDVLRLADPAAGDALLHAARALRERSATPDRKGVEDIDAALSALAADPKAGGEFVGKLARASSGDDQKLWLDVAAWVRPLPTDVSTLIAERIRGATAQDAEEPFAYLLLNRAHPDLTAASPALHLAFTSHLDRDDPLRGASMRALGRLKNVDSATIDRMVAAARDGEQASYDALIGLRDLGEQARPYLARIVALEPSLSPTGKFLLAQAVVAIGGDGVGTYLARRVAIAPANERATILENAQALAKVPDASIVTEAMARLARSDEGWPEGPAPKGAGPTNPLDALAKVDPTATRDDTSGAIAEALADSRPSRRADAVRAVSALTTVPPRLLEALARLADDPDESVRAPARTEIARGSRLGDAAKALVPTALRLLRASPAVAPTQEQRVGLLRTIAAGDPDDRDARAALVAATSSASPDERLAGLFGLSRVKAPTAAEKSAVATTAADPLPRVQAFATSVLALPGWH